MMGKWVALCWISISLLFVLSLWFSATAIISELHKVWDLSPLLKSWVTASVHIGFISGTLISACLGITDRYNNRSIFSVLALFGAIFNGLLIFVNNAFIGIILRLLTGLALAGVYPPAVKLLTQWFPRKRGTAMGVLIGALSLGSALPHVIVTIFSFMNWQYVILASSCLALVAAIIVRFILIDKEPLAQHHKFSMKILKKVLQNRPVMLANFGYFGHMWELYGMWTWLPAFLMVSFNVESGNVSSLFPAFVAFVAIGIGGGVGCVIGGIWADKIGKSKFTILALSISAMCSCTIGFTYGKSIWVTVIISTLWGMSVIGDSGQFSASVAEFAQPEYIGTALTFQMSVGFFVTTIPIYLISILQPMIGWEWVFTILSIGPILSIVSMMKLRRFEIVHNKVENL
ncbi:MFS transporter [Salirhabdus salicampi]|uniref:MFS transporter n=1 Tax=Salirhabdus salicampi TaxID=476102 RepID=UPI0020C3C62D|nr:MFS transporter [Salirhabdus salicampi]MCP8616239.1 MFS transporter [Salirhabdus salicampi]